MQLVHELVHLDGEDAKEAFGILYPNGGMRSNGKNAIEHLLQYASDDFVLKAVELEDQGATGFVRTKFHILEWSYPFQWITLYLRVTKKAAREAQRVVEM